MKIPFSFTTISGGSRVKTYRSSNDKRLYFALVDICGTYPARGVAVNRQQTEGIYLIKGELKIVVDGRVGKYQAGDVVYFEEGGRYTVTGHAQVLVAISPATGGKTEIVNG